MPIESMVQGRRLIDALKNSSLSFERISTGTYNGDPFVYLPKELMDLYPGSYVSPDMFLESVGITPNKETKKSLLGDRNGHYDSPTIPTIKFKGKDGGSFSLTVLHGATNPRAMNISRMASKSAKDENVRGHYQDEVLKMMSPLLLNHGDQEQAALEINEDCGATGETQIALLKMLASTKLVSRRVRINVAVATAQSVLTLKKFALDNDLDVEFNVGFMAFGLSKGVVTNGKLEHTNYIVYPSQLIRELNDLFGNGFTSFYEEIFDHELSEAFVVGDMGNFSAKLKEKANLSFEHNLYRSDTYLPEGTEESEFAEFAFESPVKQPEFREGEPTEVYLPNGGNLIRAFKRYLHPDQVPSEIFIRAKRTYQGRIFGVSFPEFPIKIAS